MKRSSTKELITPFENPKRVFRSKRRLFETPGLVESSSPAVDLFSDIEEHSEEETTDIMTETMEQYLSKTRGNYRSGVVRPKINDKTHLELKGQFLKELRENTFSASEHEDANEHIEKVLEIIDLFHIPEVTQDQVMLRAFLMSLTGAASRWLRNEPSAKRHEENSNIIKEIRASTDAAIRNHGALIKTLEIQIGQMSKVLQERGIRGLPGSPEPNPRDHVKSIPTAKANSSAIRRIGSGSYAVSDVQYNSLSSETVSFPSRLHGYYRDD
ncbi:hypothetical protein Tco_1530870 [Tanacetum coccineum]